MQPRERTPIGIDLGTSSIKAAQLVRTRTGWRMVAGACFLRSDGEDALSASEFSRLLGVLDRAGFTGDKAVLGAPRTVLRTALVDAPPRSSGAPVEQICAAEFARMFRLSPGSSQIHLVEVPNATSRNDTSQMAISGISDSDAERLIAPFDNAGLLVEAIDLASEARCRASRSVCREGNELTALLDVGSSGIGLSVFRKGDSVYHRWLNGAGVDRLVEAVCRSLSIEPAAARMLARRVGLIPPAIEEADSVRISRVLSLGREYAEGLFHDILRSLAYVLDRFPGESVAQCWLIGGGACVPGLGEFLAEFAGLEMEVLTPERCGVAGGGLAGSASLVTATGHAMWGSGDVS